LHRYEQTAATEEIVYDDGLLLLKVNRPENQIEFETVREARRNNGGVPFDLDPRRIMVVDADSGETLWQRESVVMPTTLATDGQRVFYHDGEQVVGLDRGTGEELWKQPVDRWSKMLTFFTPTLVVHEDVVLFAGGEKMKPHRGGKDTMTAMDAETGEILWTGDHGASGYQSAEDLLVSGGLVWSGETTGGGYSGRFTGRDPKTGEVKIEFEPDVETYWFHHRCYRGKATENYLLMSRTGIEFLDPREESWTINHWVRGGCLYGIMPCNGLIYAPPSNCACYPEIKLNGFNALAPARSPGSEIPVVKGSLRLQKGPAYDMPTDSVASRGAADWPTYRGDNGRSGCTSEAVSRQLSLRWQNKFPGRLSAPVIAGGTVYVAAIDEHRILALSEETGALKWTFTAGGRIDSPPTIHEGRVYFGSLDGSIYCLRARDGELAWRYLAAPSDTRLVAYEQVESLWPVRGSVLIEDGRLYALAGRNAFLDGGLRLVILDPDTGELLKDNVFDDKDPETGENLQNRVKVLNMPTGLNDILSSDGENIYWMSQVIDKDGNRGPLGPDSGKPEEQGAVQRGETAHLFAPFGGYLDGDWFHRSYWIFGRSFAGGHAGYHQAGKYTPAGRILVFDDEHVYGFGRKREYYKWTTPLEYQLFNADRTPLEPEAKRRGEVEKIVQVKNRPSLNPSGKPLVVQAWVKPEKPAGVIVARGGPTHGFALVLRRGVPHMVVRSDHDAFSVAAGKKRIVGDWHHVTGVLTADKELKIYVDGELAGSKNVPRLIAGEPAQPMEVGSDEQGTVGDYDSPFGLTGLIDDVKVYFGEMSEEEIAGHAKADPAETSATSAELVLHVTFDDGKAKDVSGNEHHGTMSGVETVDGKFGVAARFEGRRSSQSTPYYVVHNWKKSVPLHVRAMTKAAGTLLIMGPPDILDEDDAFKKPLTPDLRERFRAQDQANDGDAGAILMSVDADSGEILSQKQVAHLPRWDGMAAANGHVFVVTESGDVVCLGK
ncbi:MAG: PQQ-binding-like beta-propeller repeat protein, partial [Planctomycetota bacterium]